MTYSETEIDFVKDKVQKEIDKNINNWINSQQESIFYSEDPNYLKRAFNFLNREDEFLDSLHTDNLDMIEEMIRLRYISNKKFGIKNQQDKLLSLINLIENEMDSTQRSRYLSKRHQVNLSETQNVGYGDEVRENCLLYGKSMMKEDFEYFTPRGACGSWENTYDKKV
tara:strand:+ start:10657 stop:11160 length:504 start_codon:yes stop_codon:yes gene_type:complete